MHCIWVHACLSILMSPIPCRNAELVNFLLRAPQDLLEHCTLFQAGQVVTYLKQLGIKNEFLAKRVFAGKKGEGVAMPETSLVLPRVLLEFVRMLIAQIFPHRPL